MKWMIVSFLLLPIGFLGCENKPSTTTGILTEPTPFESIDTLESLRQSLEKQLTLSPQALQFIQKMEISQRKSVLLFCKNRSPDFRERAQQLLSIVAKKDILFQKQLILWLDEEESVASASELVLGLVDSLVFSQAAKTSKALSPLGRVRLLRIFQQMPESPSLVEELKNSLASADIAEQDFALDCMVSLTSISPESILAPYLHQENIADKIALKLSTLGNADGAEHLLKSLDKADSAWHREVGKAFFRLGEKGIPAMRAVLQSSDEPRISHVLKLQLILKHEALLLDILPLLLVESVKEQAYLCLCGITGKDAQWDLQEWKKIILKE